jgi:hypothetical protein
MRGGVAGCGLQRGTRSENEVACIEFDEWGVS